MRIYVISRSRDGIVRCLVRQMAIEDIVLKKGNGDRADVSVVKGTETGPTYRLRHAVLHSPTGFECGYGGSGPADLAASILADFYNVSPRIVRNWWNTKRPRKAQPEAEIVIRLHEHFKAEVISRIQLGKGEEHQLTADQVAEWIAKHNAAEAERERGPEPVNP